MNVFEAIVQELNEHKIDFEHFKHSKVHTSQDAAAIRGNSLSQAAKAIVLKAKSFDDTSFFIQAVLQGDKKIDIKKLKESLNLKKIKLASPEEVLKVTGCTIGSVPPFGHLFGLEVLVDKKLFDEETIFFSAGSHFDSIKLSSLDYANVIKPRMLSFSF